jgi:hypothetical protein
MTISAQIDAWLAQGLTQSEAETKVKADLIAEANRLLKDPDFLGLVIQTAGEIGGYKISDRFEFCPRSNTPDTLALILAVDGMSNNHVMPAYRRPS